MIGSCIASKDTRRALPLRRTGSSTTSSAISINHVLSFIAAAGGVPSHSRKMHVWVVGTSHTRTSPIKFCIRRRLPGNNRAVGLDVPRLFAVGQGYHVRGCAALILIKHRNRPGLAGSAILQGECCRWSIARTCREPGSLQAPPRPVINPIRWLKTYRRCYRQGGSQAVPAEDRG